MSLNSNFCGNRQTDRHTNQLSTVTLHPCGRGLTITLWVVLIMSGLLSRSKNSIPVWFRLFWSYTLLVMRSWFYSPLINKDWEYKEGCLHALPFNERHTGRKVVGHFKHSNVSLHALSSIQAKLELPAKKTYSR